MNQSAYNVIQRQAWKYSVMSGGKYEPAELVNVAVAGGAGDVSALSFICTIARCRIIDFLRKETRYSTRFKTGVEAGFQGFQERAAKGNDFTKVDAGIDLDYLREQTDLSQKQIEVLKRHYIQGQSFKEIAGAMGYAGRGSVHWIHAQAIKKIRSILR